MSAETTTSISATQEVVTTNDLDAVSISTSHDVVSGRAHAVSIDVSLSIDGVIVSTSPAQAHRRRRRVTLRLV